MPSEVSRTKPKLWERVKRTVIRGSKGGPSGKWSARKAQLAVKMYKSSGGGYRGKKSPRNSLTKWSREDWGYVSGGKPKSKTRKRPYGRYLPRKVRESLSAKERRSENRRKGSKSGKWVPYGKKVLSLMHKYKVTSSKRRSCWKGYIRVPGKRPGTKGSCRKK